MASFAPATGSGQSPARIPITDFVASGPRVELREAFSVGFGDSLVSFGRIMDIAFSKAGRIYVADDLNHRVTVLDSVGRLVSHVGREGRGPGEFQSPWVLALDDLDSLFVWDAGQARVMVFDPNLTYRRQFTVPPQWLVNSMRLMTNGQLLVAASGRGERNALHVLGRDGALRRDIEFPTAPAANLRGFESSLLGGTLDVHDAGFVYSNKSPYEISFLDTNGRAVRTCVGNIEWTAAPHQVISTDGPYTTIRWAEYVHSARVIWLATNLVLNTVLNPGADRRVIDVLTTDCRLVSRQHSNVPLTFMDQRGTRLVAARTIDYPEVVVYDLTLEPIP